MRLRELATRAALRIGRVHTATDGRDILHNTPDGWEIDRPWLWWNGPADGSDTPVWGNPPPGADQPAWTNIRPAMARCRSLIVDALAGVPWMVYRDEEVLPTPEWISDPQGLRVDQRVQSTVLPIRKSAVEFWAGFILSALEIGEGIVYCPNHNLDNSPKPPLFLIDPLQLKIEDGVYVTIAGQEPIDSDDLIIMRNRVLPGSVRGIGIWQQFASEVGYADSIRSYATNMLGTGIPQGYLKVTAPDLSPTEATNLRNNWLKIHGGKTRSIAVLNAVTDFEPLQLDPQAVQLAELERLSAWEIAMMYGIPPYKLGISMGYNNTYANIESAGIDYVQDALLPWSRRIESCLDSEFPRGTSIKLNLDGLRRADTKSRYEAHKIGLDAGFLTVNEVRAMEDLPPVEGGDDVKSAEPEPQPGLASVTPINGQPQQPAVDQPDAQPERSRS